MRFLWLLALALLLECVQLLLLPAQALVISSINVGPRKYKSISFGKWWLPPIAYSKKRKFALSFHKHKVLRRPKFKFNVNMPIQLPVELHKVPIGGYASQFENGWA